MPCLDVYHISNKRKQHTVVCKMDCSDYCNMGTGLFESIYLITMVLTFFFSNQECYQFEKVS